MYNKVTIGEDRNRKIFEVEYVCIGGGGTQVGIPMFQWYVVR
jgi:hypothetical protein